MKAFRPQHAKVFRPYPDEVPWELLRLADPDEDRVVGYLDADFMRVAKVDDEAVGVYVIKALTPTCYELLNLAVAPAYRKQGLGRWLLGHAIGIAESKGGREIVIRGTPERGLFQRTGFKVEGDSLRLVLMPE